MTITSQLIPHQEGVLHLIFETHYIGQKYRVGLGIGHVQNDEVAVTPMSQQTVNALIDDGPDSKSDNSLVMQEIKRASKAKEQVLHTLRNAPKGSVILFVCADDHTQAAAIRALGVKKLQAPVLD